MPRLKATITGTPRLSTETATPSQGRQFLIQRSDRECTEDIALCVYCAIARHEINMNKTHKTVGSQAARFKTGRVSFPVPEKKKQKKNAFTSDSAQNVRDGAKCGHRNFRRGIARSESLATLCGYLTVAYIQLAPLYSEGVTQRTLLSNQRLKCSKQPRPRSFTLTGTGVTTLLSHSNEDIVHTTDSERIKDDMTDCNAQSKPW